MISALAVVAALSSLVVAGALLVRAELADANAVREDLAQEALTRAGLELAAYQVFWVGRSPSELAGQRVRLDSGLATLSVSAENGKVDLNGADAELLAGLWRTVGESSISPQAFANRVIDWRDPDDDKGLSGAERQDYAAAGVEGPANAAFQSVDDVWRILGVSEFAARRVAPYLTVGNPRGVVSASTASRTVLRSLPNGKASMIDQIVSLQRAGGEPESMRDLVSNAGVQADVGPGRLLGVVVDAKSRSRSDVRKFFVARGLRAGQMATIVDEVRPFDASADRSAD